ncbi:heparinase II/III family protein [Methylomonas sp. HW2-6]|uniref:heparinase II/III family protein n=1 Tax=Methylomonas sp. HW2-6 TaxID=3376687 RepID=UPI0040414116
MKPSYPSTATSAFLGTQNSLANSMPVFLVPRFAAMTPAELLTHFHQRAVTNYFPLKPGKAKHISSAQPILNNEFTLNNETHRLGDALNWLHNPSPDLEWLILLHKFYYSRDLALAYDYSGDESYANKWVALISSWIEQVPDGFVNSQVTGRRLQQWLLAYHYFVPGRHCSAITAEFLLALLGSIQSQAVFLSHNLTPQGNHRTIELYAIFAVALVFPELSQSAELLAFAQHELMANLRDDFLADGVQKELSTDYHHTVLKNFLRVRELADLNGLALPEAFDTVIRKALEFSIYAHKPDGWLPAINDGDINSYLSLLRKAQHYYPGDALSYVLSRGEQGKPPAQRSRLFADSGYSILRSDWTKLPYANGRYLIFDCGQLGFGSHGHYDLLSFEMAAFGRSLIVDPGRYSYHEHVSDGINWRHVFKGTAAHNTIMVDGKDQIAYQCHEPVGPQPRAAVLIFESNQGFDFVHGRALSPQYEVDHQRSIFFAEAEYWIISDLLLASEAHRYEQFFHLAPEAQDQSEIQDQGIRAPNLLIAQAGRAGIEMSLKPGWVSPEYGVKQPAPVLSFSQECAGSGWFQTVLYPFKDKAPALRVEALSVTCLGQSVPATQALALSIRIQSETTNHHDCFFVAHQPGLSEYHFADVICRAQVVFIRRDAVGGILSVRAYAAEWLEIGVRKLLDSVGRPVCLNYAKGQLQIDAIDGRVQA